MDEGLEIILSPYLSRRQSATAREAAGRLVVVEGEPASRQRQRVACNPKVTKSGEMDEGLVIILNPELSRREAVSAREAMVRLIVLEGEPAVPSVEIETNVQPDIDEVRSDRRRQAEAAKVGKFPNFDRKKGLRVTRWSLRIIREGVNKDLFMLCF